MKYSSSRLFFKLSISFAMGLISCGENSNSSNQNANAGTLYPAGKTVYQKTCITCHQPSGVGLQGVYPPLAGSDYLLADKFRAIRQVIKGSSSKITVNGKDYQAIMPPQPLNDSEIASVLNYVAHSFGNNGFTVSPEEVKGVRDTAK